MMKRAISDIMMAVMLLVTFTACESESLSTTFGGEGKTITIRLNAQGGDLARAFARSERVEDYGENTIATADVFFYDADDSLLYSVLKGDVTLSTPDADGVVTATVPMPSDDTDLTQAKTIYVIGNRQATDAQVESAKSSEADLRAMTFTTATLKDVPTSTTTFVMDGSNSNITISNNEISGEVELVRAAAKITLTVNIPSTLTDNGGTSDDTSDDVTYEPKLGNITVSFHNGVKTFGVPTDIFSDEEAASRKGVVGTTTNGTTSVTFAPFYSYPTKWKAGDSNEPYLTLAVQWAVKEEGSTTTDYRSYYYRVPVNKKHFETDEKTLVLNRNHWYKITLDVGVLGTPAASDEVEVTGNYEVAPWGNLPIGANLLDYVYLIVDKNQVEMDNINSVSVGYKASHDIDVKIIYISRPTFASANSIGEQIFYNNTTGETTVSSNLLKECTVSTDKETNEIILTHELVNEMPTSGTNFDYSVYTVRVVVTMTAGGKTYTETIEYKQYPERYIEGEVSSGNVFVDTNTSKTYNWRHIEGGAGSNSITYIVNVTALEEGSDYFIGDPRTSTYSNLGYSSWISAPTVGESSNRGLSYYYPARYEGTDVDKIIAPKFRVASSYGRKGGITNAFSQADARKRCAGYQEDGFPAGRWRVPTAAEILYVSQLCNRSILTSIFDGGQGYWSATQVYSDGSLNRNTSASVRCVYDEWYWGSDQLDDPSTFTWGDAKR